MAPDAPSVTVLVAPVALMVKFFVAVAPPTVSALLTVMPPAVSSVRLPVAAAVVTLLDVVMLLANELPMTKLLALITPSSVSVRPKVLDAPVTSAAPKLMVVAASMVFNVTVPVVLISRTAVLVEPNHMLLEVKTMFAVLLGTAVAALPPMKPPDQFRSIPWFKLEMPVIEI